MAPRTFLLLSLLAPALVSGFTTVSLVQSPKSSLTSQNKKNNESPLKNPQTSLAAVDIAGFDQGSIVASIGFIVAAGLSSMMIDYDEEPVPEPVSVATTATTATTATIPETIDVTIPYDSAAHVAYNEWRAKFNKGDFDEKKFEAFKVNYHKVTVANVINRKIARKKGTKPKVTLLKKNADRV